MRDYITEFLRKRGYTTPEEQEAFLHFQESSLRKAAEEDNFLIYLILLFSFEEISSIFIFLLFQPTVTVTRRLLRLSSHNRYQTLREE